MSNGRSVIPVKSARRPYILEDCTGADGGGRVQRTWEMLRTDPPFRAALAVIGISLSFHFPFPTPALKASDLLQFPFRTYP